MKVWVKISTLQYIQRTGLLGNYRGKNHIYGAKNVYTIVVKKTFLETTTVNWKGRESEGRTTRRQQFK